mmetsp:Transcript_211/g.385  ORF Transcript_211/g.385 Transcript_211/m.385 type:complete len:203 (+) Transcript_211:970-1578(+)
MLLRVSACLACWVSVSLMYSFSFLKSLLISWQELSRPLTSVRSSIMFSFSLTWIWSLVFSSKRKDIWESFLCSSFLRLLSLSLFSFLTISTVFSWFLDISLRFSLAFSWSSRTWFWVCSRVESTSLITSLHIISSITASSLASRAFKDLSSPLKLTQYSFRMFEIVSWSKSLVSSLSFSSSLMKSPNRQLPKCTSSFPFAIS